MTSSKLRGRSRRAGPQVSVRVVLAVLGGVTGIAWLVLPGMTTRTDAPVAITGPVAASPAVAPAQDGASTADLVLPLVAAGAAGALAGYGYLRRVRRARTRTTPGGSTPSPPRTEPGVPDDRARAALVAADDRVRAARDELGFPRELFGAEAVAPFADALREAERELAAAFRMRQRHDDGVPEDPAARRQALAGIVGRSAEAERRLDAAADGFRRLRGLEQGVGEALAVAEARFRELTGRTAAAAAVLGELRERYAATASATVTGYVEQAKDRLVFATVRLNQARQADDAGHPEEAARHLRTAEGAVAQAAVLVGAVERTAAELREAAGLVPAALTGAEAELAPLRDTAGTGTEALTHVPRADAVLSRVRQELTSGRPYDPVGILRRVVRAISAPDPPRAGVLAAAGRLTARGATAAAADFVATHRGAVGATSRTRLAEAHRLLADGDTAGADALALEARALAEQDVRVRGNPYTPAPPVPDASRPTTTAGTAGAVLGGIIPADDPENAHPAGFTGRPGPSRTPPT
ncbi:hypothetical protein NFX46_05535 [Streptomyces phaeoluteigriseus]|uniref:TPM domain-containing protein n=1 Tax=Streptomyces phaeoluteigriseus TaxID=114686 RepID=A0ABY4Z3Q3_9ACTN|nr:hypothetical protein [Streptomyces phaeoluteigriseus]USQ83295.1 hypothetical protein NFX46_05535 [Streptomyces phaeoluteigriseus]